MKLFMNEYVEIEGENGKVFLTVLQEGLSSYKLHLLLRELPTIQVTSIDSISAAVEQIGTKVEIGSLLPLVEFSISKDKLSAYIRINCTEKDLQDRTEFYVG